MNELHGVCTQPKYTVIMNNSFKVYIEEDLEKEKQGDASMSQGLPKQLQKMKMTCSISHDSQFADHWNLRLFHMHYQI